MVACPRPAPVERAALRLVAPRVEDAAGSVRWDPDAMQYVAQQAENALVAEHLRCLACSARGEPYPTTGLMSGMKPLFAFEPPPDVCLDAYRVAALAALQGLMSHAVELAAEALALANPDFRTLYGRPGFLDGSLLFAAALRNVSECHMALHERRCAVSAELDKLLRWEGVAPGEEAFGGEWEGCDPRPSGVEALAAGRDMGCEAATFAAPAAGDPPFPPPPPPPPPPQQQQPKEIRSTTDSSYLYLSPPKWVHETPPDPVLPRGGPPLPAAGLPSPGRPVTHRDIVAEPTLVVFPEAAASARLTTARLHSAAAGAEGAEFGKSAAGSDGGPGDLVGDDGLAPAAAVADAARGDAGWRPRVAWAMAQELDLSHLWPGHRRGHGSPPDLWERGLAAARAANFAKALLLLQDAQPPVPECLQQRPPSGPLAALFWAVLAAEEAGYDAEFVQQCLWREAGPYPVRAPPVRAGPGAGAARPCAGHAARLAAAAAVPGPRGPPRAAPASPQPPPRPQCHGATLLLNAALGARRVIYVDCNAAGARQTGSALHPFGTLQVWPSLLTGSGEGWTLVGAGALRRCLLPPPPPLRHCPHPSPSPPQGCIRREGAFAFSSPGR